MEYLLNFFEDLDEMVYISDMETNELVYMNRKTRENFGFQTQEEIKGKKCYEVMQHNAAPCSMCNNQELVAENGKYSFVMPAQDVKIYAYFTYMGGSGGGSIGGGGGHRPSKPTEPTWEEVDGGWKLKGTDGKYLTGWQKVDGKWYLDIDSM